MIAPRSEMTASPAPHFASAFDIAIVGGGFSGTAIAIHLLKRFPPDTSIGGTSLVDTSIVIFERQPRIGRGVAFGTECPDHILNIPAGRMSVFADQPDDFCQWLNRTHGMADCADRFVARGLYGEYLEQRLRESMEACRGVSLKRITGTVISIRANDVEAAITTEAGETFHARMTVLATGNCPPAHPAPLSALSHHPSITFAWNANALDGIPDNGSVLLLGNGLTAIDQVIALKRRGFQGSMFMLSRRGLLPETHAAAASWPSEWTGRLNGSVRRLVSEVRRQIETASLEGVDWRGVIDGLRPESQRIWSGLSTKEKRRFLRHLRPWWESVRHRVPQGARLVLAEIIEQGRLSVFAGRLVDVRDALDVIDAKDELDVIIRERGAATIRTLHVHRIVNCTGPGTETHFRTDPLMQSLLRAGLGRLDAVRMGLDINENGALIGAAGQTSEMLYAIGPLRRGSLWETTAVPEIRLQAAALAQLLLERIETRSR
jgi:uncharacterized NAD(P)/FAD-binding protein YdhS